MSAKVLWTRQRGDNAVIEGDKVEFDAANSLRTRVGGRVTYAKNTRLKQYMGAYLDYEFLGEAKAAINGEAIASPELKGATAVGELGFGLQPSRNIPLTFDLGAQGYLGTREGFSGSLYVKYEF